jgi:predicted Ser/Thr protein kinase
MAELQSGTFIDLTNGGKINVMQELGRGGQGIVYLSVYEGHKYALKWYTQNYSDDFENFQTIPIETYLHLLNTSKNPEKLAELAALRKECRKTADQQ